MFIFDVTNDKDMKTLTKNILSENKVLIVACIPAIIIVVELVKYVIAHPGLFNN